MSSLMAEAAAEPEVTNPPARGTDLALSLEPALSSALARVSESDGGLTRVLLRDSVVDLGSSPIVAPSSDEMPEIRPDRYQLFGEIARGGMGAVLKGRDVDLRRDLAVKVGSSRMEKRNYDGALAEFRESLRLKPDDAEGLANLGNALVAKGDVDGAIVAYEKAARRDPVTTLIPMLPAGCDARRRATEARPRWNMVRWSVSKRYRSIRPCLSLEDHDDRRLPETCESRSGSHRSSGLYRPTRTGSSTGFLDGFRQ
jgi:tetratricopeptide (TPR) repeat protein